ncbi:MAG: UbiA family prenyltransferase [Jhaorihella sp.]
MEHGSGASFGDARDDRGGASGSVPLVIDIDGTLLRSDLLFETFWAALGRNVWKTLSVLFSCRGDPARMKAGLRAITEPGIAMLPVRQAMLDLALEAQGHGRGVHLASAADQALVDALGRRFGLKGPHFGSDGANNLKAEAKARLLRERFGAGGYDYAGNSRADLAPWAGARKVIAVNPGPRLTARLEASGKPLHILTDTPDRGALLRELRPLQWIKNLLLFLPALAAHETGPETLLPVLVAVAGFSLGASGIYIVNDLLDLEADRSHPAKRSRPVASGALPIPLAMAASPALVLAAMALGLAVSPGVAALILTYMTGSLVYSLWLKKRRWLDLAALAGLFLLRVLTGAVAAQVPVSAWLLGFVVAVFFTLACAKRLTELARARRRGHLPGRSYGPGDAANLERAAYLGAGLSAGLFVFYSLSPSAATLYASPRGLALATVPVALWLVRVVRLSSLGSENYDPVVFVFQDRAGLAIAAAGLAIVLLAR